MFFFFIVIFTIHIVSKQIYRNVYCMDWYRALSWMIENVWPLNAATDQSESGILESSVISDTTSKRSGSMPHYPPCPINKVFHYFSQGLFVLCAWPSSGSEHHLGWPFTCLAAKWLVLLLNPYYCSFMEAAYHHRVTSLTHGLGLCWDDTTV